MPIDDNLRRRAQLHAALADPVRLGIVDELTWSDRTPSELRIRFGIASNLLAHHLDVLEVSGVVSRSASHGDGRRRYVRLAQDALGALTSARRFSVPGVAFVCSHNSARSQLAAALWRSVSPVPVISGGTDPAAEIHPGAAREAERRGLDLSGARPTAVDPGSLGDRLVVTVCDLAHESLDDLARSSAHPILHWSIADPAAAGSPAAFASAADQLAERIAPLAAVTDAA